RGRPCRRPGGPNRPPWGLERSAPPGGRAMSRRWLFIPVLAAGVLFAAAGRAQKPADTPATTENIEAAARLMLAAARAYEIRGGTEGDEKPLELVREPKLKWSNPAMSDVKGSVFLWTSDGRTMAVGRC